MTVDQSGKAMAKSTRNGTKKSPREGGGCYFDKVSMCWQITLWQNQRNTQFQKYGYCDLEFLHNFVPVWGPSLLSSKSKKVISKEAWYIIIMQKSLFLCML